MAHIHQLQRYTYENLPQTSVNAGGDDDNTDFPDEGTELVHFRIMRLHAGSGSAPIAFDFKVQPVSKQMGRVHTPLDFPHYEAVSYCWYGQAPSQYIYCNGSALGVSSVVHEMLTHLRQPDCVRWLWIDAVCIDQSNLDERASQVSIMRQIYSAATRTLAWLGATNADTSSIFRAVTRLINARKTLDMEHKKPLSVHMSNPRLLENLLAQSGLPESTASDPDISSLVQMLENPYFERVWIIQEITVSQNVIILQGHMQLPWTDFSSALLLAYDLGMADSWPERASSSILCLGYLHALRQVWEEGQYPPLRLLLGTCQYAKATDPRDKVYALAGISACWDVCHPTTMSYSVAAGDVFRGWTIVILQSECGLDVLHAATRYPKSIDVETRSWVPDWTSSGGRQTTHMTSWPEEHLQATRGSNVQISEWQFREKYTVLGLSGHTIDRIAAAGTPVDLEDVAKNLSTPRVTDTADFVYWMWTVLRNWEAVAQLHTRKQYSKTGESMSDAYWQTLSYGEVPYEAQALRQGRVEFEAWRWYFLRVSALMNVSYALWLFCLAVYWWYLGVLKSYHRKTAQEDPLNYWGFHKRWATAAGWRRIIRTEQGYIGLASYAVEVGDMIALVKGGRLPLVIRKAGEEWRLAGDAYVHGVMQGELWDAEKCETFWIR